MRLVPAIVLVSILMPGFASPTAEDTPSALATAPEGWTDLLAEAGPSLKGWTRQAIPAAKPLKSEIVSQWSLDPKTGILVCQGDGGHEWLRWDKEVTDAIFHVEWRYTRIEGKKGYNSGIYTRNSADAATWHQAQTGDGSGGLPLRLVPRRGQTQGLPPRQGPPRPPRKAPRRVEHL